MACPVLDQRRLVVLGPRVAARHWPVDVYHWPVDACHWPVDACRSLEVVLLPRLADGLRPRVDGHLDCSPDGVGQKVVGPDVARSTVACHLSRRISTTHSDDREAHRSLARTVLCPAPWRGFVALRRA